MTSAPAKKYGSDLVVDLMNKYELPWIALNPGASYRGLHDSLVNYGDNRPEIILCPHEEIAVFVALGYAKAIGKPMIAAVHDTVGLLHCAQAIYHAYLDRVPLLLVGGTGPLDPAKRRPGADWIHTAIPQAQPLHDFLKWDRTPLTAQEVVESFARAYRIMLQEPQGPVYLCYDAGFQEEPLEAEVELPDPTKFGPGTRMQADLASLDELADRLLQAEHPVIVAGYMGRNPQSFHELVRLAEVVGAAVVDGYDRLNFPTRHPLNVSNAEGPVLAQADLVLALDVKNLFGALTKHDEDTATNSYLIPPGCQIAEIGFRDVSVSRWSEELAQIVPVDLQIIADTAIALPELNARVEARLHGNAGAQVKASTRGDAIAEVHRAAHERWDRQARDNWDASPVSTGRLALEIWDAIKDEDWVLTSNTLRDWALKLWDFDQPYRYPGTSGGMGTGSQAGVSLGVALAYRGTGKLVVNVQPDGDLMFDPGALWVAAHSRLPMLIVMNNNRAYYNDWDHQIRVARRRGRPVENAWVGQDIDDPAPDFAAMARSMGVHAEGPIDTPGEVAGAIRRAIAVVKQGLPALVDVVTQVR